jgi:hypothetical protein
MKQIFIMLALCIIFIDAPHAQEVREAEDLDLAIKYLLDYVARSECVFIRNGREHNAKKASRHMHRKYKHFKDEINTPEDFIRLAGTKSMRSGKPYRVRLENGKEVLCSEWLNDALENYRKSLKESKGEKSGENECDPGEDRAITAVLLE